MPFMDVYTSIVALLLVGLGGGLLATALRLPRVVVMILLGVALMPAMHPSVLDSATYTYGPASNINGVLYGPAGAYAMQNPASSIRTMALLIALMRGGLSIKLPMLREQGAGIFVIATVPYLFELFTEAALAPQLLPKFYGTSVPEGAPPALVAFTSASVWAALSPSIVIPNMIYFVEHGLTEAGKLVLTGAPLEVSTALITEGVMSSVLTYQAAGGDTLGHIATYTLGSVLYGLAFAAGFWLYVRGRKLPAVVARLRAAEPSELLLAFCSLFVLCYTTSIDDVNTPWLVGFFAALCMAVATQAALPALADELCGRLKPVWVFAEAFLFVLTGCVIRPAIDAGISLDLFGWFLAVLVLGSLARMAGDVLAGALWHWHMRQHSWPWTWPRGEWADVARRVVFLWAVTMPKATLQGSLGPKLTKTFKAAGFATPSAFIAPSSAIAILYASTVGSLLTYTVGWALARHFQDQLQLLPTTAAEAAGSAMPAAECSTGGGGSKGKVDAAAAAGGGGGGDPTASGSAASAAASATAALPSVASTGALVVLGLDTPPASPAGSSSGLGGGSRFAIDDDEAMGSPRPLVSKNDAMTARAAPLSRA